MNKESFLKVIEICGGQVALARLLGVKQGHVYGWLNENKAGINPIYVIPCCKATDWQVTPHELRPDLYPYPQDGLPPHLREVA